MKKLLFASMMCADLSQLKNEVCQLEEARIDGFHCDVMDGSFVPNMALGLNDLVALRQASKLILDVHLMIENPGAKIDWFIASGADLIYVHPESERYVSKTLLKIKAQGILAGIALNPDTALASVIEILPLCDYILLMSVNPGFAGSKFLPFVENKIKCVCALKKRYGFKVIMDGACSKTVIQKYSKLGIDGFILGSSALFHKNCSYRDIIAELQNL